MSLRLFFIAFISNSLSLFLLQELMLIANGMENEALLQRQRVKELEDYLDNLLLRVMETHPKILQNPYSRTTSAKRYAHVDIHTYTRIYMCTWS